MRHDSPPPRDAPSGGSADSGESPGDDERDDERGETPAADLERLADLDDRLGGHGAEGDTPGDEEPPPEGLDAILLLRQLAAEEGGAVRDDARETPRRIGRFAIVREVGRGGFATVYEAFDTRLLRRVALKVARPEALVPRGARRRFVREAELAARLDHPHIVTIHEAGEADGHVFIAEELCTGGSLADWLERHPGPMPPRAAARVVLALAGAVAHSHGFCILHRDIKPANVLLVPGESGVLAVEGGPGAGLDVKLADFGLGKLADAGAVAEGSDLTRAGARVGTPAWMAPEQAERAFGPVGPATDIYGLGLLLDRLLTGRCIHAGSNDAETLRLVLTAEPVPADRVARGVPADLVAVTLKCLAKQPGERYATVADLAGDLARFLDGRATIVRPVTLLERAFRVARRHRGLVAAMTVAGAATVVASGALWLETNQRRQLESRVLEVRGHQAAATLRRGFESWRTGDVVGALSQWEACRQLDPDLAASLAGRWLRARIHGEEAILAGADGPQVDLHSLSVAPDGGSVAAGGADGLLRIVRAVDGEATALVSIHDEINHVAFSPDGRSVATAGQDGRVAITAADGRPIADWDTGDEPLFGLAWGPEGTTLASGGGDRSIRIHAAAAGGRVIVEARPFDVPAAGVPDDAEVEAIAFLGADRLVASCGRTVALLDAASLDVIRFLSGHEGTVGDIDVSADGRRIVTSGSDRQPRVWDAATGELLAVLDPHPSWVAGCRFTPDGRHIVTGCRDGIVRVLPAQGGAAIAALVGHVGRVWDVGLLPDGDIVSSGRDGTVRRWDPLRTAEFAGFRVLPSEHGTVMSLAAVSAGVVVAPRGERCLERLDRDGLTTDRVDLPFVAARMAIDRGESRVAVLGQNYEIATAPLPGGPPGPVRALADAIRSTSLAWLAPGRLLFGHGERLVVWDDRAARLEEVGAVGAPINAVACTTSGPPRAVVCAGKGVWIFDFAADGAPRSAGRRLLELPARTGTVDTLAWSPDGASFVIGTNTGEVERFDAATGLSLGSFARHGRGVISLDWSPAGRTLLSADSECVRLSDVRTTTVFDEFRPGWPIVSAGLRVRDGAVDALVVAGNAPVAGQESARIEVAPLPRAE